jgi:hypothetical protein
MQFSPHKPHNVPKRFVALIPKVCTRAPRQYLAALPAAILAGAQPEGKSLGGNPRKDLQELRAQINRRRARQTQAGDPLHRTQSRNRKIHHDFSLYRQVTLMWNWY